MIRIQVQADGSVTGDVGRVIAYENQTYSEPIRILHPNKSGCINKVVYTWGHTQFVDFLDSKDEVTIHVHGSGIVKLQFIMEDATTGEIKLASKPFELIVHKNLNVGPNRFVTSHINNNCCPPPYMPGCNPGTNELEVIMKLGIELAEEQNVRASQDSLIWEDIFKIKEILESMGATMFEPEIAVQDCNLLYMPGEYNCAAGSPNAPTSSQEYKIQVKRFGNQILQTAYLAESGETRIYYRTGLLLAEATEESEAITQWDIDKSWVPMIHEGNVMVIEDNNETE